MVGLWIKVGPGQGQENDGPGVWCQVVQTTDSCYFGRPQDPEDVDPSSRSGCGSRGNARALSGQDLLQNRLDQMA